MPITGRPLGSAGAALGVTSAQDYKALLFREANFGCDKTKSPIEGSTALAGRGVQWATIPTLTVRFRTTHQVSEHPSHPVLNEQEDLPSDGRSDLQLFKYQSYRSINLETITGSN